MQIHKLTEFFKHLEKTFLTSEDSEYDLLETALTQSRKITNCDGGTLYLKKTRYSDNLIKPLDIEDEYLDFEVMQNTSMNLFLCRGRNEISIPPVSLMKNQKMNTQNVSAHSFNTNSVINIENLYDNKQFDFSGAKKYDETFGYKSVSMLVFPLKGRKQENIGVFQLINKKDTYGNLIPFSSLDAELMLSISMIMGMIFSTQSLYIEHTKLLDSLIDMIAKNIEEKSPHTLEHIQRVTILSEMIAEALTANKFGIYRHVKLKKTDMEEIKKAAMLHDIGKISVPEHYLSKEVKLQNITDRMELIVERYNSLYKDFKIDSLEEKIKQLETLLEKDDRSSLEEYKNFSVRIDGELKKTEKMLFSELKILHKTNYGSEFLEPSVNEVIDSTYKKSYKTYFDSVLSHPGKVKHIANKTDPSATKKLLTKEDKINLQITKGTLNAHERKMIENHAGMTWDLLLSLHLPTKLKGIAMLAGSHHETLDGTGYPKKLTWKEMPVKVRIISIADLIEALSSKSRPYRNPFKVSEFMAILGEMVKNNKIDGEVLSIFIHSDYFKTFVSDYLLSDQSDSFDPKEWKKKYYVKPPEYE